MHTNSKTVSRRALPIVAIALTCGLFVTMGGCPPELLDRADQLFGTAFNPPVILSVTPNSGPATGGTSVTIRGLNFETGTGVLFGDTAATTVKRTNSNLLEVVTPAGVAGPVNVTVIAGDEQIAVLESGFAYIGDNAAFGVPAIASIQPDRSSVLGGTRVTLVGGGFAPGTQVLFGGFLGADVEIVSETVLLVTVPAQAAGKVDVSIRSPVGQASMVAEGFEYVAIADADSEIVRQLEARFPGGPRVVSAVATDNTSVEVTFSEPVSLSSGQRAESYSMVIPEGGLLLLDPGVAPKLDADQTTVDLTTLGMADATYQLTVSGIRDLAGNSLASPDILVNPTQTKFTGIAPAEIAEHTDTDGDGLADWFEMLGWSINIELANGVRTQAYVTSNPFNSDTDNDGLSDSEENARSLDPRTDDTDADLVTDFDEVRLYASNPTDQDTDDDGFADKTELMFKTSLTLADTDGDQLDDREELIIRNRNPRLSDLPIPQIVIGTSNIEIDERFTYTDEQGVERSVEMSSSASFTQSDTTTFSESDTRSNEATNSYSQAIQAGFEVGSEGWKFGGQAEVGFGQERGRGYTSTVSEESSQSIQEEYTEALSEALAVSERQSVTRNVENARVSVDLSIVNAGDVAFTISNLEVSARVKDPNSRDRFLPMATLLPSSGNNEFNLGPAGSQRGPFIFENSEIFPNLAQDLIREPRATIFEIANFDIVDEYGRNFAFTLEEINDLTAGITIDFGDGLVETYRVATASTFDVNGIANGITMREALTEIVGLAENTDEGPLPAGTDLNASAIRESFGTRAGLNGEQVLTRVRGVQAELDSFDPAAKFWVVLSTADIPDDADFGDLRLRPGDNYRFWYVQDADDDGLFAREEFMAGSSDLLVDTDDDGMTDFEEVRTGWLLATSGNPKRVYSHPGRADTDLDQVPDALERRLGMDPRSGDTDGDGLKDNVELAGYSIVLLDGDTDPNNNPEVIVLPYSDAVIIEPRDGGDGLAIASTTANPASDDEQLVLVGDTVVPGQPIIGPGPDGIIDTVPEGDEFVSTTGPSIFATESGTAATERDMSSDDIQLIRVGQPVQAGQPVVGAGHDGILQTQPAGTERIRLPHRALFASDPVQSDSDADGLVDGREDFLGSRPNVRDADTVLDFDFDGLTNQQELDGWQIGGTGMVVTSDPNDGDTDNDGLPDIIEWGLLTNPRLRDSDGDGLNDIIEADLSNARGQFDDDRITAALARCDDAFECNFTPNAMPVGTDPLDSDTDSDGLSDGIEINGWQVRVVGEAIVNVTSDPFDPNSDTDTLTDYQEYRGFDNQPPTTGADSGDATDPRNADTDSDGVSDSVERSQNSRSDLIGSGRRNPLRRDQLLKVGMTSLDVDANGEIGAGQFIFKFQVTPPGASASTLVDSKRFTDRNTLVDGDCNANSTPCFRCDAQCGPSDGCDWVMDIDDSQSIVVPFGSPFARTLVIAEGQSFDVYGYCTEVDGDCEDDTNDGFPIEGTHTYVDIQTLSLQMADFNTTGGAGHGNVYLNYQIQIVSD